MSHDLVNIRRWYDDKNYAHDKIIEAIHASKDKVSIKHVERILTQFIPEKVEIDEDVENALDEIFKKIK